MKVVFISTSYIFLFNLFMKVVFLALVVFFICLKYKL